MTDVRIRIVTKSRTEAPARRELFTLSTKTAKDFSPDPERARECHRRISALNIEAHLTPGNSLDIRLDESRVYEMFGVGVDRRHKETFDKSTGTRDYDAVHGALKLPDQIAEVAEFAYVPQPVEFFAPSFVPPNASVYHLRIADVGRAVGAGRCHRRGWTGRGVRIAMADTGFARHPYFDHHGYNITRVSTPQTSDPAVDDSGHGTGESANALAVAPDCEFVGIKHDDYSALALETSLAQQPNIMTHSWGWNIDRLSKAQLSASDPNTFFELLDVEQIILDAIDDGVVSVFSAGNGHFAFPGSMPDVISAGGVTVQRDGSLDASSYASSFRSQLYPGRRVPDFCGCVGESRPSPPLPGHIMLPVPEGSDLEGENLPASQSQRGWGIFSGTSAAAPQIAGIVALILNAQPGMSPEQVKRILADTARDVTRGSSAHGDGATPGVDFATGAGFVDAFAACLRASQLAVP